MSALPHVTVNLLPFLTLQPGSPLVLTQTHMSKLSLKLLEALPSGESKLTVLKSS